MPRIRSIKPEFWQDSRLARLPTLARCVYLCLWSMSDDEGRIEGDAETVWHFGFPRESVEDVSRALASLREASRVVAYEGPDGVPHMFLPTFTKHQKIDHPSPSKLPAPPTLTSDSRGFANIREDSPKARAGSDQGSGIREGIKEGRGGEAAPPPVSPSASKPPEPRSDRLAQRTGDDVLDCAKAIRELVTEGVPMERIDARIEVIDPSEPIGVWTWKRATLVGWKSEQTPRPKDPPGANPPVHDAAAQASRRAEQAARAIQQSEFDASGYTSRAAWQADRKAGALRTGLSAAVRRFDPVRGAHDEVPGEARVVP